MDIAKLFSNPIRLRIIQNLIINNTSTANMLATDLSDVPKTTLYRHLNYLESNNVLTVVQENRIRGTLEKVYELNKEFLANTPQNPKALCNNFFLSLLTDFEKYFDDTTKDPISDMLFFRSASINATDDEYKEFLMEIGTVIQKHLNKPLENGRKVRTFSTISSPYIEK